jgi:hypothetical protein
MKALAVVSPDDLITQEDIQNLNVDKLKAGMLKNIYTLQFALFSQAGMEYNRISKFREALDKLEPMILNEEEFNKLDYFTKVKMYQMVSQNLNTSLQFLQGLHDNVATGLGTLNEIQKHKDEKPIERIATGEIDRVQLDQVKKLIENKIKQRIDEKKADKEEK